MTSLDPYAPDTLFFPYTNSYIPMPENGPVLFLNAALHEALKDLPKEGLTLQQNFYPYAKRLEKAGYTSTPLIENIDGQFAHVFVGLPKNQIEAEYLIANALSHLIPGGTLTIAADNKAGGSRLEKTLQSFGVEGLGNLSKHKARVIYGAVKSYDATRVKNALLIGAQHNILGDDYISQPGIFGWDKIDKGSEILLQNIPQNLNGKGADFGCGYGFLAKEILRKNSVSMLHCLDADARAIEVCRKNVNAQNCTFKWMDLTDANSAPRPMDFVVMNPPFHEGKLTDSAIGVKFILTAARVLRSGGQLYMVANAHLPYEASLQANFRNVEKLHEGQGFKVYKALR